MKRVLPLCLALLSGAVPLAQAAFYQWTDSAGVVHFTDNVKQIPEKYRKKAKKMKLRDDSSAVSVPGGTAQQARPAAAAPTPAPATEPGGHPERWWRERYAKLHQGIKETQDKISEEQTKLVELRRKRALYHRARDREAINATAEDVTGDEKHLAELQKQLEELEAEATRAGVPMEWRR